MSTKSQEFKVKTGDGNETLIKSTKALVTTANIDKIPPEVLQDRLRILEAASREGIIVNDEIAAEIGLIEEWLSLRDKIEKMTPEQLEIRLGELLPGINQDVREEQLIREKLSTYDEDAQKLQADSTTQPHQSIREALLD